MLFLSSFRNFEVVHTFRKSVRMCRQTHMESSAQIIAQYTPSTVPVPALRYTMDYIYKINLNLSNIGDTRQLSKWLK